MLTPAEQENIITKILQSLNGNPEPLEEILLSEQVERDLRINDNMFSPKHKEGIRSATNHLKKFTGDIAINKIMTKQTILSYRVYYLKTLKGKTYWSTLKAFFQRCSDLGLVSHNYFNDFKLPKKQDATPIIITESEQHKILEQLNTPYKEIILFLLNTGLRCGELTKLQFQDVSLSEDHIIVGKSFQTKNFKTRIVPLNPIAKRILETQFPKVVWINQKNRYVFTKQNGFPFTVDRISKVFKATIKKAGLREELHLHCTRGTFCSRLLANGVSLYKASLILGHSNLETTRKFYSNIGIEPLREAVNTLNK